MERNERKGRNGLVGNEEAYVRRNHVTAATVPGVISRQSRMGTRKREYSRLSSENQNLSLCCFKPFQPISYDIFLFRRIPDSRSNVASTKPESTYFITIPQSHSTFLCRAFQSSHLFPTALLAFFPSLSILLTTNPLPLIPNSKLRCPSG
jgi:hypothetical protein